MSIAIPDASDKPQTDSLADINHAMQSAAESASESNIHHDDIHSAVVGGDFGGRVSQDFIPDRQIAQLRIPPVSIEAESSVLGGFSYLTP